MAILAVLSLGLAMLLSALFVRYRDISPIWEVFAQALFYASPILYVTTMVPESFQHAYVAAPLAAIFCQMRHAMIDPDAPPVWEAIGGAERLLIPGGLIVIGVRARLVGVPPRGAPYRREPLSRRAAAGSRGSCAAARTGRRA